MHVNTTMAETLQIRTIVRDLATMTVEDDDPLVVAADVVANSLSHHSR